MAIDILTWWVVIQLIGLAALPLAGLLFRALPDRGHAFAKPLGLLTTGYLAWLLAMLGLGSFGAPLLIVSALAMAGLGWWAGRARGQGNKGARGQGDEGTRGQGDEGTGGRGRILPFAFSLLPFRLLPSEAIFLAAFLFVAWMRSYDSTPWGTERPMDFAFFNAIQASASFPPNDPWLAGYSINYYYFGYLLMAAMAQLAGTAPTVSYNLALALIFAMTAQGVAGVIVNLIGLSQKAEGRGQRAEGVDQPLVEEAGWGEEVTAAPRSGESPLSRARERGAGGEGHEAPPSDLNSSNTPNTQPAARSPQPAAIPWLLALLGVLIILLAGNQSGAIQVILGDERAVALDGAQLASALGQAIGGAQQITLPYPAVTGDFATIEAWERQERVEGFNWWWPSRSLWDEQPDGVRIYTITEFPFFSFRLGDMHPHVMALPFGVLALALALGTLARPFVPAFTQSRGGWAELLLTALILGSLYAINSWDLPTYVLLYAGAFTLLYLRLADGGDVQWRDLGQRLLLVLVFAFLLFAPFHLTFRSLVGGAAPLIDLPIIGRITSAIAPYTAERSGLHEFVIIFGLVALPLIGLVYLARPHQRPATDDQRPTTDDPQPHLTPPATPTDNALLLPVARWLPPGLLILGLLIGFPLLALLGLGLLAGLLAYERRDQPALSFALLVVALGCAVIVGTELIFIRDVFSNRMNTIFKFYYQIWLLWGALAPFALWWLLAHTGGARRAVGLAVTGAFALLLVGGMVYPALTLRQLVGGTPGGLSGATPREWSPAGRASIEWLRRNAAPGSVVLEAVDVYNLDTVRDPSAPDRTPRCGGSYNGAGFGGVSAATGLPTVLGWSGHQTQWRGGDLQARNELDPRCVAVFTIYDSLDPNEARSLLERYKVRYIYVGALERNTFAPEALAKFDALAARAWEQDEVVIFKLP